MLLNFVLTVIGVAFGVVLAMGFAVMLFTNTKVTRWYMKRCNKVTKMIVEGMDDME